MIRPDLLAGGLAGFMGFFLGRLATRLAERARANLRYRAAIARAQQTASADPARPAAIPVIQRKSAA